ncbi:hypothetical protein D9V86_00760 [Bacteroidetes/Chlorobi group bacterium ChocPot_Mid]|jgi:hypothetical protein|nr:MAG: hypothetical protein D9V86_00760 [Bacteroidetes/Chlorobi group bacterium ChocPot_Mid]
MLLSQDTNNILDFLDYSTSNSLRKRNDIGTILELSASYNEINALQQLLFDGSSLWNIHKALKRHINDTDSILKLQSEYQNLIGQLKNQLTTLVGTEHPEVTERFNKIYLNNSAGATANLIDLSHDLAELKFVIARLKSPSNQENSFNSSASSK